MTTVGVKDLRDHLSDYLQRVRRGERVVVTDRGRPVAAITALDEGVEAQSAWNLVSQGLANWNGGKPVGSGRPPRPREGSVADAVLEDRR